MRGTPAAYEAAKQGKRIEQDTLYFLYEQDAAEAILYLGTKLISGGAGGSLASLTDILISENLADKSILVYDKDQNKWIDSSILDAIPIMVGPNETSSGVAGLVPPPPAGAENLFLSSSGEWVSIDGASEQSIITYENEKKLTHEEIFFEINALDYHKDDILIIKDLIYGNKWQYTSYIHNGSAWTAMDGHYNAENVYFDEDLITTVEVGNITLTNGQATIPAAGKNLKEVFNTIFVQEKNPEVTQPSVSFDSVTSGIREVGIYVTPSYNAVLNTGAYEFGPQDTLVEAIAWTVTNSEGESLNTSNGNFSEIQITDTLNYTITANVEHSGGSVPITNIGNLYDEGTILQGTKTVTSNSLSGYRKTFYGTTDNKDNLTSISVRSLAKSTSSAAKNGTKLTVDIPLNAMRVVIAYPATLRDITSILDVNGMNAEILPSFTKSTLQVEGAEGYTAIDYKVYTLEYAKPNDKVNTYSIQI